MKGYREEAKLDKHMTNGCTKFGEKVELPSEEDAKEYIQFKNTHTMLKKPFVIYADFESLLLNVERDTNAATQKYQKHEACGYAYKRVSTVPQFDKPLQLFRGDSKQNVAEHFINAIVRECDEITRIRTDIRPKNLTEDEKNEYDSYRVPVIFHNLKGYDSHLIIKAFNNKNFSISCIPTTTEKYLSFTISGKIQFIDSMSFIDSSLEKLVEALPEHKFKHFDNHFKTDIEKKLLRQKGGYPYDYMNSYDRFNETSFPTQKDCYSQLNKEPTSNHDYDHALNVCEQLNVNLFVYRCSITHRCIRGFQRNGDK